MLGRSPAIIPAVSRCVDALQGYRKHIGLDIENYLYEEIEILHIKYDSLIYNILV